ncbi:dienelactone hydrolase family protein, partial [bacterium]|nr:dienelactone hydrolase family protein [bacterium]
KTTEKVPAVVFSHGSEGVSSLYFDVWAKALNTAGYAVFVVDSFKPRNEDRVTGPIKQLTWKTTANLADALNALKLVATHPQIDANRIYHMGWSRGGQVVLDAAWPTYQQHIVPNNVKWAGSIAIYPGCNMRYRVDEHGKLPAPLLLMLAEKDEMTLPKPCIELADEYAAAGNPVTYKVYAGATHVFDRLNQPWRKYQEGNYNACSMDVRMPYGAADHKWRPAVDKYSGKSFSTLQEWSDYLPNCQQTSWVTVESNAKAREQAVRDAIEFLNSQSVNSFASATEWTGTMSCIELPTGANPQMNQRVIAKVALQIEGNRAILIQSRHSDDEKLRGRLFYQSEIDEIV